jgi:hypothetical protein
MTVVSPLSTQKQWTIIFLWSQRRTRGDATGIERYNRTIAVRNSPLTARSRSLLGWFLEPAHDYSLARGHQQFVGMSGGLLIAIH